MKGGEKYLEVKKNEFPVMFQKLSEMDTEDGRFTKVRIWLMHLEENFNNCTFSKAVVDDATPTLEYIPIVGFTEDNSIGEDDFSDHRYVITRKNGAITRKYMGNAYGTILSSEDNNAHYEDRLCDDGITRTFLVVDGIMWNMFEGSSEIMNRDLIKSQSMELDEKSIEGFEDENFLFHFTKLSFRAACILGFDQEPAMINSTVEVQFTMNDFVKNIQTELSDKLNCYTNFVKNSKENEEGGIQVDKTPTPDFSLTVMEQFQEIASIVSAKEQTRDYWGDMVSTYRAIDIQEDEVIVVNREDHYNFYGFKFTMEGDLPVIDFATKTRKKTKYEDFIEGTQEILGAFSFAEELEDFTKTAEEKIGTVTTEKETVETDFTTLKEDYDGIKPKYDAYVIAENERFEKETTEKKVECFAKFDEHLADIEDYTKLKESKESLTLDEIEAKCAIMYTSKTLNTNFTKKENSIKPLVADIPEPNEDANIVHTKYGNIKVGR